MRINTERTAGQGHAGIVVTGADQAAMGDDQSLCIDMAALFGVGIGRRRSRGSRHGMQRDVATSNSTWRDDLVAPVFEEGRVAGEAPAALDQQVAADRAGQAAVDGHDELGRAVAAVR